MNYCQLTREQRYTIAQGKQAGMNQSQIAALIGVHQSTISRELRRNRTEKRGTYNVGYAHERAMERRKWTVNNKSVKPQNKRKALSMFREQDWSPEQISGYLLRQEGVSISTQTIYN